jgi:hypothetical protein
VLHCPEDRVGTQISLESAGQAACTGSYSSVVDVHKSVHNPGQRIMRPAVLSTRGLCARAVKGGEAEAHDVSCAEP